MFTVSFRRRAYIGKLKFAHLDTVSATKKAFVATEENVVAALDVKSGNFIIHFITSLLSLS